MQKYVKISKGPGMASKVDLIAFAFITILARLSPNDSKGNKHRKFVCREVPVQFQQ